MFQNTLLLCLKWESKQSLLSHHTQTLRCACSMCCVPYPNTHHCGLCSKAGGKLYTVATARSVCLCTVKGASLSCLSEVKAP